MENGTPYNHTQEPKPIRPVRLPEYKLHVSVQFKPSSEAFDCFPELSFEF